ncbi:contact-dependent growth inhibition system immunity protein [Hazenella coriacea]|uniref:Uncharacterized protein n=1 Tax=Hazenella coriacea TaxID=1179467 RepID=A0A4V2UVR5_9BACL|nr:contact-dependent growth inhibition system immunity protein [Hazenella coriacea]TCS96767.1 hypothetical protein EDD58_101408 [Hazenella coriacea]
MKSIKDIYKIALEDREPKYALEQWYSRLAEKSVDEIDINDICRMLGQDILVEIAVEKAIEMLKVDPLAGWSYDGQLIELLYSLDDTKLGKSKKTIEDLLHKINENLDENEFICPQDYEEYMVLLRRFQDKLKSN